MGETGESMKCTTAYRLDWNTERNAESIRVHPEADNSFVETVATEVEHHAPALTKCYFVAREIQFSDRLSWRNSSRSGEFKLSWI